ncbi:methyl-accepting chemotaxis protein [Bordetella genomosp. 11]|uniref:Methyl-accepting transducer domain-containing protein n=1 Tax=Bordetella genomosp. 11 TaxID=1416808 RepID=A0A261UJ27_9BORD|nr:methyl-accepting chemotaxis protein [Bordetella genomosp. 11]OZI61916.1 hypothetical protein CAL28_22000 [Bordetella genomosp. 11]
MRIKRVSFGRLLGAGFAMVVVLGCSASILARHYLTGIAGDVNLLANVPVDNLIYLQQIKDGIGQRSALARDEILDADRGKRADRTTHQADLARQAGAAIEQLGERVIDSQGADFIKRLQAARPAYDKLLEKVAQAVAGNDIAAATRMVLTELPEVQAAYLNVLNEMAAYQQDQALSVAGDAATAVGQALKIMTALAIFSAVFGAAVAIVIIRSVRRQLGGEPAYAAEIARRIAEGDLSGHVRVRRADASSLLANMEAMRRSLADIVGQVRQSSVSISAGAAQMTAGNEDLSRRTEAQAASLEQTAASMEQMTATVRQTADTVRETAALTMKASEAAAKGGDSVKDVVKTMDDITASATKIGNIISIIDSIAFQTNILALNAAVEAARAGEQGRGFAVVASEVRALAQRSAQAAREITELVQESVAKVRAGSQIVGLAGARINDAVEQVRHVAGLISGMGTAAHEQEQGISQVGVAVTQLDETTQRNAALVEEAAAAAKNLDTQAARLVTLVSAFKVPAAQPAH